MNYQRKYYRDRKRFGICTKCGITDAIPGTTMCNDCHIRNRTAVMNHYRRNKERLLLQNTK